MEELDECDEVKLDRVDNEVVFELLDEVELRQVEVVEVIHEQHNLIDETEAEHIDGDDEVDGDEVTEVYEMIVEMMINEREVEVDM